MKKAMFCMLFVILSLHCAACVSESAEADTATPALGTQQVLASAAAAEQASAATQIPIPTHKPVPAVQENANVMQETLDKLKTLTPNADYVEYEVVALCEDMKAAQALADLLGAALARFDSGVAVFHTTEPLVDFFTRLIADDLAVELYPNYIRSAF